MDLNEYITNAEDLLVMERAVKACIMQAGAIADIFNEDIWNPNFTLKREEFRCYPVLSAGILALRRAGRDDLLPSLLIVIIELYFVFLCCLAIMIAGVRRDCHEDEDQVWSSG